MSALPPGFQLDPVSPAGAVGIFPQGQQQQAPSLPPGFQIDVPEHPLPQVQGMTEADVSSPQPQRQIDEGEQLRPSFMAVGGTLGGIAGSPLGPLGAVAGGALGTTAGALGYDVYRDIRRKFVNDPTTPPTPTERLARPAKEGAIDAAIGLGITGARPIAEGVKSVARRALGVGDDARRLAADAERKGVGLGIADVAEGSIASTYLNTVGRMPLLGGPARTAQARKAHEWAKAWDTQLGNFGPAMPEAALAMDLKRKSEGVFGAFRAEANKVYKQARELGEAEGAVIPAQKISGLAYNLWKEMVEQRPMLRTGERASSVAPDYVRKFVEEMTTLPPKISTAQAAYIEDAASTLMDRASVEGFSFKQADNFRRAVKEALTEAAGTSPAAKALMDANSFFARGVKSFEGPTASKFGRVDKNAFRVGFEKPGSLNEDELFNVVLNMRSPKAIADLQNLVGSKTVGNVARRYIETAYGKAREAGSFNVTNFANALNLTNPQSNQYQALSRLIATTGGDIRDFKRLVDIAQKTFGNEVPDVSTFVARRAMLGGAKSAAAAVLPVGAGAVAGGTLGGGTALLGVILARYGTKVLSDPKYLKALIRTYDPKTAPSIKVTAGARLLWQAMQAAGETPEPGEFNQMVRSLVGQN